MFRKFSFIFLGFILLQVFIIGLYSCNEDLTNKCRVVASLTLSLADNAGLDEKPVQNNTVFAKALIIRIEERMATLNCFKNNVTPLINTAMASYKRNEYKIDYRLITTRLFANRDYDAKHKAGEDLSELFHVVGDTYYLMSAPDDTTGTYTFQVENVYAVSDYTNDTSFKVSTNPLKLLK